MRNKLLVAGTLALAMTCTTVFSSITPAVVKAASVSTAQTQTAENSDDYVYCYAGLTWAEYWKAEGVMAAGDTTSSDTADSHDEKDKGAFDAVTRAPLITDFTAEVISVLQLLKLLKENIVFPIGAVMEKLSTLQMVPVPDGTEVLLP